MLGLEFGDAVHCGPLEKLERMWADGAFLWVCGNSGEVMVGNDIGIWEIRTIRGRPVHERWLVKNVDMVTRIPWRLSTVDEKTDGGSYTAAQLQPGEVERVREPNLKRMATRAGAQDPLPMSRARRGKDLRASVDFDSGRCWVGPSSSTVRRNVATSKW